MKRWAIAVSIAFTLNGCVVGYRNYPREQLQRPAAEKRLPLAYYTVDGTSLAGGYLAIHDTMKKESPFVGVEERPTAPNQGTFIKATVETIPMGVGAIVAGYVSYATLTILPSWSLNGGARVVFSVYKDGTLKKTYTYEGRRFIGVWLGLLPFAWANFLTANEQQVFRAMTKQFFEDAHDLLAA